MSFLSRSRWWWIVLLPLAGAAGWLISRDATDEQDSAASSRSASHVPDVPPPVASPYVNTAADVAYVGSESCAACHQEQHASYLQTAHSRALSDVDPALEPPDAEYVHTASRRRYRVYRQDGELRHRESLASSADVAARAGSNDDAVLNDYPLRFLVGSGRHSRTYLAEIDGFLIESPVTWYASQQRWAMSPGYDRPQHAGFQRTADTGCLICHAGRVEPLAGSVHRVQLHELAIGCESCHGPGSLHVERHSTGDPPPGEDLSIVHPARLSRERQEDTCAMCHLRGDATVLVRGRRTTDFRPGLRLADFRVDYVPSFAGQEMKVVGHVEQMRLSRCYTQTDTLTCTTCHDPHAPPAAERRIEHYRQACLTCHTAESCELPVETRRESQPADACAACHMPQVPTDIPHIAFTHHRIGRHAAPASQAAPGPNPDEAGELVPLADTSHLPELERERLLGLAYLEFGDKAVSSPAHRTYRDRARELLEGVHRAGVRDPEVTAALARLLWEQGRLRQAREMAESALNRGPESGTARINALFVLGEASLQLGDITRARGAFERLIEHRRHAEDWLLLGLIERRLGNLESSRQRFERAAAIDPGRADIQRLLAPGDRPAR